MAASALQLAALDHWIGWDAATRRDHLHRVVGLSRFLIRSDVRCRNLASHVLGQFLGRHGADFSARYGFAPWLIETFVSLSAAGKKRVILATGRGLVSRRVFSLSSESFCPGDLP